MKILKYKLATETNHGTPEKPMMETVLSDVSMPYATEADYQLALSEAWQGEVTVEEVADTTDEIRARRDPGYWRPRTGRYCRIPRWTRSRWRRSKHTGRPCGMCPNRSVFPVPLLGRRCRSLQISPDLCGFLGRQPPGGYQLIQTAIVPKAGIVGPRHIIHCHNATPCIAAKKSTSARSCS